MPPNSTSSFFATPWFVSSFNQIITGMQTIADQILPVFLSIAFVLLVFGAMRGFMQPDTRHFLGNILRATILVALIGNWQGVTGIVTNTANAFCNLQIQANFGLFGNGTTSTSARLDISQLANLIQQKATGSYPPASTLSQAQQVAQAQITATQPQAWWQQAMQALLNGAGAVGKGATNMAAGVANFVTNPIAQTQQTAQTAVQNYVLSPVTHYLCLVLDAIFILALLLCELIVVLMELLQRCILVFLSLYIPVGFAEFSIPSLRGQAQAFFKTYIGIQCWPVGWVFVNVVTLALLQNLVSPNPENVGQLLWAIVLSVPVFFWVVIGHVLAPFYAQKLVTRGGAELQAFAGAMIAAVGGTSASLYGTAFALGGKGVNWLDKQTRSNKSANGRGGSSPTSHRNSGRRWVDPSNGSGDSNGHEFGSEDLLGALVPGINEARRGESEMEGKMGAFGNKIRTGGFWTLRRSVAMGEFGAETAGNLVSTVGALVADASSHRIGPESRFSFPRTRRNAWNRSSQRATDYLNYQDFQF
jgi:hypothetical protein